MGRQFTWIETCSNTLCQLMRQISFEDKLLTPDTWYYYQRWSLAYKCLLKILHFEFDRSVRQCSEITALHILVYKEREGAVVCYQSWWRAEVSSSPVIRLSELSNTQVRLNSEKCVGWESYLPNNIYWETWLQLKKQSAPHNVAHYWDLVEIHRQMIIKL